MESNQFIEFIKKHTLGLLIAAVCIIIVFIASRFSFITINVQTPNNSGDFTYRITDEAGETKTITNDKPTYRKLVGRGKYSVEVSQNNKNYFAFVSANGFFMNREVSANLASEKSRSFVGDNPNACMTYGSNILLSYSCDGAMKTLKAHMPAVSTQASYAKQLEASGDQIEGMVRVNGKSIGLIKPVADNASAARLLTVIDQSGTVVSEGAFRNELTGSGAYQVEQFRDGLVVAGASNSKLYYYQNPKQLAQEILLTPPKDTKLSRYAWGTSKDSVALAYANLDKRADADAHAETTSGATSVVLWQDGKSRELKIKGYFTDIKPCGTKKLCVINGKNLQVYEVTGKPKLLFSLPGVQAIENSGGTLLVATESNILSLDVDSQTGAIDYSLGDYAFCGMSADTDGYQLCLINEQQRKVALRVDRAKEDNTNIDKKILQLQKSKAVSLISIYGNTISVVPNYGALVYNPNSRIYENDKATVARMNSEFASDLKASGINTSEYIISGLSQ